VSNEDVQALLAATRGLTAQDTPAEDASNGGDAAQSAQETAIQLTPETILPADVPPTTSQLLSEPPSSPSKRRSTSLEVSQHDHGAKRQRKSPSPSAPAVPNVTESMINDIVSSEELNAILADAPADLSSFDAEFIDGETLKQALELLTSQVGTDFNFSSNTLVPQQASPASQHGSTDSTPPPDLGSSSSALPQDLADLPVIDFTSIPKDRDEMILWIAHQVKKIGDQQQELDLPASDETDPERIAERERVREENRERKRRWREGNADRNKDNDLRCRVTKRANKIYGHESTLEKKLWIDDEFVKRRAKRLSKEHTKNYNGEGSATFDLRDSLIDNKTTELLANIFSGEAGAAENMQKMLEGGNVDLQALSEALQTIAEDETVMRHITTLLGSGSTGEISTDVQNDVVIQPTESLEPVVDPPHTIQEPVSEEMESAVQEILDMNGLQLGDINLEGNPDLNALLQSLLAADEHNIEDGTADNLEGSGNKLENTGEVPMYDQGSEEAIDGEEDTPLDAATLEALQAALASFAEGGNDNMELIQMLAEHLPQDLEDAEMSGMEQIFEEQNEPDVSVSEQVPETSQTDHNLNTMEAEENLTSPVAAPEATIEQPTSEVEDHLQLPGVQEHSELIENLEITVPQEPDDSQLFNTVEDTHQPHEEESVSALDMLSSMDLDNIPDLDPEMLSNLTRELDQEQLQALIAMVGQVIDEGDVETDHEISGNDLDHDIANYHSGNEEGFMSGAEQSIDDILSNNHDIDAQMQAIAKAHNIDMTSPEFTNDQPQATAPQRTEDNFSSLEYTSTYMQNLLQSQNKPGFTHIPHTYDPVPFHRFQTQPPPPPPVCTTSVFLANPSAPPKKSFKRSTTTNTTIPPPRMLNAPIPPPPSSVNISSISLPLPHPPTTLPYHSRSSLPTTTTSSSTVSLPTTMAPPTTTNYSFPSPFFPTFTLPQQQPPPPRPKSPMSYSPSCDETAKLLIKPPPYKPSISSQRLQFNETDDGGLLDFLAEYAEYDVGPPMDMDHQRRVNAMGFPPMLAPIAQKAV